MAPDYINKNILMFGSPSVAHFLMHSELIDDYWIFMNAVLLAGCIPIFTNLAQGEIEIAGPSCIYIRRSSIHCEKLQ